MRLFVRHRSDYVFSQPQARLVQLLRLTPGNHHGQSIVSWRIDVDRDARLKAARDGYGNEATMLYIDGPIERICFDVSGEVLTEDRAGMVSGTAEPLPPVYFLQATALTKPDAAILDLAEAFAEGGDALDRAHRLTEAIEARLTRTPPDPAHDQRAVARLASGEADPQGAARHAAVLSRNPAISASDSFNSFAALRQNSFSLSAAGMSKSSISLIARGFSEVSGGASLP